MLPFGCWAVGGVTEGIVQDDVEYADLFDRFEYLLALAHIGASLKEHPTSTVWGPPGRFAWRAEETDLGLFKRIEEEANGIVAMIRSISFSERHFGWPFSSFLP